MLAFTTFAKAQAQTIKEFSEDPKVFIKQLETYFADTKTPETQSALKNFSDIWIAGGFGPADQADIISMSNAMLKQRLRPSPDFENYLNLVSTYQKASALPAMEMFHKAAQKLIVANKRDLKDLVSAASNLIGGQVLSSTSAKRWEVNTHDYTFEIEGGKIAIIFPKTDLQLFTKEDTLGIYETSGKFYPSDYRWVGKGGTVFWTRVGFAEEEVFATLNEYKLDVRGSDLQADSALLTYTKIFPKPIIGKLNEKANTVFMGDKASYPRFSSYLGEFKLKDVLPNIDYKGGFTLEGKKILGTASDSGARAEITIRQGDKVMARALSKSFVIAPDKISAQKAAISIYLMKDSIYHSQVIFSFLQKDRRLTLSRDELGLYGSPYFDSYHKMEMNPDNIIWNVDSPTLALKSIANPDNPIQFTSAQYYKESNYLRMQGILNYNPIQKIAKFADGDTNLVVSVQELAGQFGNTPEYLQNLLLTLAREGYIFYDVDGGNVVIKTKLLHYYGAAEKKQDYDGIQFESIISQLPNAKVDLKTAILEIQGVPRIVMSDTQQTYFVPTNQVVKMGKDRQMIFDGFVKSGRFDFYGKDYVFDYSKFEVGLKNLDSVKFKFPEYDKQGRQIGLRYINNVLSNVTGTLYIDHPGNKSGRKDMQQYPIFECVNQSFVYYEKDAIFNRVYKKENFYFKVDPFIIENLDNFTAEGLQFPGTFSSADIMPPLKYQISIQEDYSLGFKKVSTSEGYPLYKGKGRGAGEFRLSNAGLRASGTVKYLTSTLASSDFIFFPDSMNSVSDSFRLPEEKGGKYPAVAAVGVYNHWAPYQDSLYIYKKKADLAVYQGKVDFAGYLILTPQNLVGNGSIKYQDVTMNSDAFAFFATRITSQEGDVRLKGETGGKDAVVAKNMTADIDLNKGFGNFTSNSDTAKILLPSQRFRTTLGNFSYNLETREVAFEKSDEVESDSAYFESLNPEQQNLKINSKRANFNLNQMDVLAQEVPNVLVADSRIYTPKNEIIIKKGGKLGAIAGAEIITSDDEKFHKIYDATVSILSSSSFTGTGKYDYIDKNEKVFPINLTEIKTTESLTTVATGKIEEKDVFFLSPRLKYMGNVNLASQRKELAFDGFVKPEHGMKSLNTQWVKVADTIDPKLVVLSIPAQIGQDGKELFTGTFMASDTNAIYDVFFGKKWNPTDKQIFSTAGELYFDDELGTFFYGEKSELFPEELTAPETAGGSMASLNINTQVFATAGGYNFSDEFKNVEFRTAGTYQYDFIRRSNLFNLTAFIDFPTIDDLSKILIDTLNANLYGMEDAEDVTDGEVNAYAVLMRDKKDREKITGELASAGYITSIDKLKPLIVLSNLKMSYVDTMDAFISQGPYQLVTYNKLNVQKQIDGLVEISKRKPAEKLSLLLESTPGSYYYFSFVSNYLDFLTSDYAYYDKMKLLAPKIEKGQGNFRIREAGLDDVGILMLKKQKPQ